MTDLFDHAASQPSDAAPAEAAGANVLTVSGLSNQLRLTVERQFGRVAVEGEISGLKIAASGHAYFSLKDDNAVISAIIWRGALANIKARLEDGLQVVAYGKVTTYAQRSNYQIIIDRMEPAGLGALMQRFEELKARLDAAGLFAPERKKALPYLPQTIGIITSPTGAVIEDMLNRLRARFPRHVLLWPVAVQGPGAKEQIAAALEGFNRLPATGGSVPRPDVIIVARGGGSLEDLWPFNEEIVVRAVAASEIPVVSGVGHEPDVTLCDYAADHRSPTPTAAAVEVVPDRLELLQHTQRLGNTLAYFTTQRLRQLEQRLVLYRKSLPAPESLLNQARLRLDDRHGRLRHALQSLLKLQRQRVENAQRRTRPEALRHFMRLRHQWLEQLSRRLDARLLTQPLQRHGQTVQRLERQLAQAMNVRYLQPRRRHLTAVEQLLTSLNPHRPLEKGYVYVTDSGGQVVKTATTTVRQVTLHFADGTRGAQLDD